MKTFISAAVLTATATAMAVVAAPASADSTLLSSTSSAPYVCHSDDAGLSLTVWRDARGQLLNALVERHSDGFGHYMACWDAASDRAPVVGDCYAVMLVDSYDATLARNAKGELVARLTQAIGPVGGERRDAGELACAEPARW